jgi:hypothetical protein
VKNSSKKHYFFLGFFAPDAYKLQPSYISDQNLQKITLNYFQSGVLTIIETTKIILRDGSVKNSSKKHYFFLGFFAPDAYKLGEKLKQKTLLFSGFLRTGCIQASAVIYF